MFKNDMVESITFFYPSRNYGGAQLLFVRLAKELALSRQLKIFIIDYADGFLSQSVESNDGIQVIPFINDKALVDFRTIIITPLSSFVNIKYVLKVDYSVVKFLFWQIHPLGIKYILNSSFRNVFCDKKAVKKYLSKMTEKGNIVFMDGNTFDASQNDLDIITNPHYIPIPYKIVKQERTKSKRLSSDVVNLAWLGRFSYEKVNSICKIIDEIKLSGIDIVFHIIGSGKYQNLIVDYATESGIKFKLVGVLFDSELDYYLNNKIDVGVGMGTSVLEFASRSIPVFIVYSSLSKINEEIRYNWFFEINRFSLGGLWGTVHERRNHSFVELIEKLKVDDVEIGELCYEFLKNNFSIGRIANELLKYCENIIVFDIREFSDIQTRLNPYLYRCAIYIYRKIRIMVNKK